MDLVHHKRFHGIRYAFILTAAVVFLWGIMCGSAPAMFWVQEERREK